MVTIAFAVGFALGRVHHISSLKAKIEKLAATLKADEQAVVAKVKALVKF
jgi:hypothetical protein